jgi:hypothetical protein
LGTTSAGLQRVYLPRSWFGSIEYLFVIYHIDCNRNRNNLSCNAARMRWLLILSLNVFRKEPESVLKLLRYIMMLIVPFQVGLLGDL